MGDFGKIVAEQVVSRVMGGVKFLSRAGGETGLLREAAILLAALVVVEVITVSGLGRGSPAAAVGADLTTPTGGCTTGLNPEGAGWKTAGTVPLVGAREMIGVVGTGKATLKRGRDPSATAVGKLAGGERLSGEALGGVSGA